MDAVTGWDVYRFSKIEDLKRLSEVIKDDDALKYLEKINDECNLTVRVDIYNYDINNYKVRDSIISRNFKLLENLLNGRKNSSITISRIYGWVGDGNPFWINYSKE